jgi:hypothetical protein
MEVVQVKKYLLTLILLGTQLAYAYEFKLQFTPRGGARGVTVVGYEFNGSMVVGDCSYWTLTYGTNGKSTFTPYYSTCTWDEFGNLLTVTPGRPTAPAALSESGTEIVYAVHGTSKTGKDTRGFGFVSTPSSHYTWITPNGTYATIPFAARTINVRLVSDGDWALAYGGAAATAEVQGTITPAPGTAKFVSSTCPASLPLGHACSVTVSYDPTSIGCTIQGNGLAYTKLVVSLTTNAGMNPDFTERFTVTGVPVCN